jgi:hypothetical protein
LACVGPNVARAQFTTIINVPPNIGNDQSIGSDTQLNVSAGGSIGYSFDAGAVDGRAGALSARCFQRLAAAWSTFREGR